MLIESRQALLSYRDHHTCCRSLARRYKVFIAQLFNTALLMLLLRWKKLPFNVDEYDLLFNGKWCVGRPNRSFSYSYQDRHMLSVGRRRLYSYQDCHMLSISSRGEPPFLFTAVPILPHFPHHFVPGLPHV